MRADPAAQARRLVELIVEKGNNTWEPERWDKIVMREDVRERDMVNVKLQEIKAEKAKQARKALRRDKKEHQKSARTLFQAWNAAWSMLSPVSQIRVMRDHDVDAAMRLVLRSTNCESVSLLDWLIG